ncbi:unnamed protein product [Taenia asiatica]|uniref:Uncharacterized protein n=1 Tax=Taenia asiatica TaxID=60517 RepID=A0A0R3W9F9_TAEAS|nr:unnamed protein product [Taenia asiatica]
MQAHLRGLCSNQLMGQRPISHESPASVLPALVGQTRGESSSSGRGGGWAGRVPYMCNRGEVKTDALMFTHPHARLHARTPSRVCTRYGTETADLVSPPSSSSNQSLAGDLDDARVTEY